MKILQVGAELFHEDRRTDRHDEAITRASEKAICFETLTAIVDQFMVSFLRVSEPCSRQMLPLIVRTLVYSRSRNPKEHPQLIKGPRFDIWFNSPRSTTISPENKTHFTIMPQLYRIGITADSLAVINLVLVATRLITISKPSSIGSARHYKSPLKKDAK
jgi:hypothetical protein